jgi:hypothetical protein
VTNSELDFLRYCGGHFENQFMQVELAKISYIGTLFIAWFIQD